jgi:hypothetical protein
MTKTYDHAVIYGGKFYPANTPIEVKEEKPVVANNETTEKPKKPTKKGGVKNDDTAN